MNKTTVQKKAIKNIIQKLIWQKHRYPTRFEEINVELDFYFNELSKIVATEKKKKQ